MRRLLALLLPLALVFTAGAVSVGAQTQTAGTSRKYPVGWNLVAAPPGTTLPVTSALLTAQPGDVNYEQVQPGFATTAGYGYWAYFGGGDASGYSKPAVLSAGSNAPYSVSVPAGQWILVGNPSGLLLASVAGADATVSFSPLSGYEPASVLQPGEGAWVGSANGAVVTVTPMTPAAQTEPSGSMPAPSTPIGTTTTVTVATAAPAPAQTVFNQFLPNPNTAREPVATWSYGAYGSYPFLPGAPILPWSSSPSLSSWPICPGYLVTAFALNSCGSLYGEPLPGNGAPDPFPFFP